MITTEFPEPEEYPCACKECDCQIKVAEEGKVCAPCSFGEHVEQQ